MSLAIAFRDFAVEMPKLKNQRAFQLMPSPHVPPTTTRYYIEIEPLHAAQFKHRPGFGRCARRNSSSPRARGANVRDAGSPEGILEGSICHGTIDETHVAKRGPSDRNCGTLPILDRELLRHRANKTFAATDYEIRRRRSRHW